MEDYRGLIAAAERNREPPGTILTGAVVLERLGLQSPVSLIEAVDETVPTHTTSTCLTGALADKFAAYRIPARVAGIS